MESPSASQSPDTAAARTLTAHVGRYDKFDGAEEWRAEITARTNAGETCRQIATALQAKGVKVSDKTISSRRVSWGLRKRATPTTKGTIRPNLRVPRPERRKVHDELQQHRSKPVRRHCKARVVELTNEGKTPDEIADILASEGAELKGGSSTVWRLQTVWKLIPYDIQRARGKCPSRRRRNQDGNGTSAAVASSTATATPKGRKRKAPVATTQESQEVDQVQHYPAECSFGPTVKRRKREGPMTTSQPCGHYTLRDENCVRNRCNHDCCRHYRASRPAGLEGNEFPVETSPGYSTGPIMIDDGPESDDEDYDGGAYQPASPPSDTAVVGLQDVMSAEIMIDLANSMLVAAQQLKDTVLAAQMHRPVAGSMSALPPTVADIATAKKKVKEAANVYMELAEGLHLVRAQRSRGLRAASAAPLSCSQMCMSLLAANVSSAKPQMEDLRAGIRTKKYGVAPLSATAHPSQVPSQNRGAVITILPFIASNNMQTTRGGRGRGRGPRRAAQPGRGRGRGNQGTLPIPFNMCGTPLIAHAGVGKPYAHRHPRRPFQPRIGEALESAAVENAGSATTAEVPQASTVDRIQRPDFMCTSDSVFFVHYGQLNTSPDTEAIALNLMDYFLHSKPYPSELWHGYLHAVCFMLASSLTGVYNEPEWIAHAVEAQAAGLAMYGLADLTVNPVKMAAGYEAILQRSVELKALVGGYGEVLDQLAGKASAHTESGDVLLDMLKEEIVGGTGDLEEEQLIDFESLDEPEAE